MKIKVGRERHRESHKARRKEKYWFDKMIFLYRLFKNES